MPNIWAKLAEHGPKIIELGANVGILTHFLKKDPQGQYHIDPHGARAVSPRLTKTQAHEERWSYLTSKLDAPTCNEILLVFMRLLHEEQEADLIQSSWASTGGDNLNSGEEASFLDHLRQIAAIRGEGPTTTATQRALWRREQHRRRIRYCDSLNWIKDDPNEYRIVWIQRFLGRRYESFRELGNDLRDLANRPLNWLRQRRPGIKIPEELWPQFQQLCRDLGSALIHYSGQLDNWAANTAAPTVQGAANWLTALNNERYGPRTQPPQSLRLFGRPGRFTRFMMRHIIK